MEPEVYLKETEHVMRQLFDSLSYYQEILKEIQNPIFITDIPIEDDEVWKDAFFIWSEEHKLDLEKSTKKRQNYFGLAFSNATLCGSILQISSMAISKFSTNQDIPESCEAFVNPGQDAVNYCIGRDVRSLPIGIIIYAARNQYNHWDDPRQRRISREVFNTLSLNHEYGEVQDPAFDLENPKIDIYSSNILSLLEWQSYEQYISDMEQLIVQ